ncbi:MAG TPA: TIR domain-containing protein [Caulobacteraceae bacterium]|jgi:adenylate cyclase|nr:TIR domain-containing protein [Caulobacteraceae bacterium]
MADIFVSYSRKDRDRVRPIVAAIEHEGWSVWWDPEIAPGQEFDNLISDALAHAKAVVVVWTVDSVASRWVRGEARDAADRGILVPIRFGDAQLPIDVRAIHTVDFDGWGESSASDPFLQLVRTLKIQLGDAAAPDRQTAGRKRTSAKTAVCVLPFVNMSGDPEQEYFSDGISEDIITDLSQVSALSVASRNSAFTFKGKSVKVAQVGRELGVTHVLEGSVRRAGDRVRITAQLIDAASDEHVWAQRFDRDLNDIFAVQDEISRAIVAALKLKLLPAESQAIAQRSTTDPEAYKYYLMARKAWVNMASVRDKEMTVRLCRRAIEIDPHYAQAWALLAISLSDVRFLQGATMEEAWEAAERALSLDPMLADAHAARGRILTGQGKYDEAEVEHRRALELDPKSFEVTVGAARWAFQTRRFAEAAAWLETATELDPQGYWAPGMLVQIYDVLERSKDGDAMSEITLERLERLLKARPDEVGALAFGVSCLFRRGDKARAMEWADHALLIDPDNRQARYNIACAMVRGGEIERALDLFDGVMATAGKESFLGLEADNDWDPVRDHPRYQEIVARTKARLGIG